MKALITLTVLSLFATSAFAGTAKNCPTVKTATTVEIVGDRR